MTDIKADLEDGFARISVTLLWAWSAAGFSSLARTVLDLVVNDTWGRQERKPGYVSRLSRADMVAMLCGSGLAPERTTRHAIKSLLDAGALQIERGRLAINPHFPARLTEPQRQFFELARKLHQRGNGLPNGNLLPETSGNGLPNGN
ncbi:MAG TPA: hypothetical protein PLF37_15005, partial [Planctomycetota bacterium]|nr:hypothetical protein [Planctomycetota bacterium]